jgi:hypothetical protein
LNKKLLQVAAPYPIWVRKDQEESLGAPEKKKRPVSEMVVRLQQKRKGHDIAR